MIKEVLKVAMTKNANNNLDDKKPKKKSTSETETETEEEDDEEEDGYITKKEYRKQLKQAKRQHNIEAAKRGTLGKERLSKVKDVIETVGSAIGTAADAKSLLSKPSIQSYFDK